MRRKARIDANQVDIVIALRQIGAKVASTAQLGKGFPDLAVAYRGRWYLLEVKDGDLAPSARKLSDEEKLWHEEFGTQAPIHVVHSVDEAIRTITADQVREALGT